MTGVLKRESLRALALGATLGVVMLLRPPSTMEPLSIGEVKKVAAAHGLLTHLCPEIEMFNGEVVPRKIVISNQPIDLDDAESLNLFRREHREWRNLVCVQRPMIVGPRNGYPDPDDVVFGLHFYGDPDIIKGLNA